LGDGSKARNGFEAMEAVDVNGDGKLDAGDDVWADLRVWRDINGDGISQNGQLFTLEEVGIKSISTGSDGRTQSLGNNNHIEGFGTFEWDETRGGGTGVSGDVYFEYNKFYREFGDSVEVPVELRNVPNMQGSGAVRDLQEASVSSSSLRAALDAYSLANTRLEQQAMLNDVVQAWAGTADFRMFDERVEDLGEGKVYNVAFSYSWDRNEIIKALSGGGSGDSSNGIPEDVRFNPSPTEAQLKSKELLEMVRVLEVFNDQYFFDFQSSSSDKDTKFALASYKAGAQSRSVRGSIVFGTYYLTEEDFTFGPNQEANIR